MTRWRKTWSCLVTTNLKSKEILALVCWDFPHYEWSFWTLDRGFWHIEIVCINSDTPIDPVFEAVNAEVESSGKLNEYRALNMKKKINPEGLEKEMIGVKKWMKNQQFFSDEPFHHTELVSSYWNDKLALPKFDVSIGRKQLFRYFFLEKYSSWILIPF